MRNSLVLQSANEFLWLTQNGDSASGNRNKFHLARAMPDSSVKGTNGRKYQPMKLKFSRAGGASRDTNRKKSIQTDAAIM